jgi:hypothetical protein
MNTRCAALTVALVAASTLAGALAAPVTVQVERPPGWDAIGTDPNGNKWFLSKEISAAGAANVFRIHVNMIPGENNADAKAAGAAGFEYVIDVDCNARTVRNRELTGTGTDGHQDHYTYPPETEAVKPSSDSVMIHVFDMVCH